MVFRWENFSITGEEFAAAYNESYLIRKGTLDGNRTLNKFIIEKYNRSPASGFID